MKAGAEIKWSELKLIKLFEAFLYWIVPTLCFLAFVLAECAAIYWFFKFSHLI
jgi:hypothetical protein